MAERVTSEGVRTVDTVLERYGSTNRPQLRVTDPDAVPTGEVVRLVVDETEYRARVEEDASGHAVIRGGVRVAATGPRARRGREPPAGVAERARPRLRADDPPRRRDAGVQVRGPGAG
uniref:DUF7112 family protein n=1 Tax=Halarchaeum acidiphilum TaxID=489138 RepID=UPI0018FF4995|nr:hypothetical protein [Halarchaeum acidiphilum]